MFGFAAFGQVAFGQGLAVGVGDPSILDLIGTVGVPVDLIGTAADQLLDLVGTVGGPLDLPGTSGFD